MLGGGEMGGEQEPGKPAQAYNTKRDQKNETIYAMFYFIRNRIQKKLNTWMFRNFNLDTTGFFVIIKAPRQAGWGSFGVFSDTPIKVFSDTG
jgi:hypothetical protein